MRAGGCGAAGGVLGNRTCSFLEPGGPLLGTQECPAVCQTQEDRVRAGTQTEVSPKPEVPCEKLEMAL